MHRLGVLLPTALLLPPRSLAASQRNVAERQAALLEAGASGRAGRAASVAAVEPVQAIVAQAAALHKFKPAPPVQSHHHPFACPTPTPLAAGKLLEGVQEAEAALAPWMPVARLAQLTERRKQLGGLLVQLQAGLLRPGGGEPGEPWQGRAIYVCRLCCRCHAPSC